MSDDNEKTWSRVSTTEKMQALSERLLSLSLSALESDIEDVLAYLGTQLSVDRCYVFFLNAAGTHIESALEWADTGVDRHDFSELTGLAVDSIAWSMEQFSAGKTVVVNDPELLPQDAGTERYACSTMGILSYVNHPLFENGELVGWLGFDAMLNPRTWVEEDFKMLRMAGALMTQAISQKKRDRERVQERELAQRLTTMGTLAAGVAHEINNPLSYVYSNLGLARELLDAQSTSISPALYEELRELLSLTQDGVEQVRSIVSDLRSFTRPARDKGEIVDLLSVLDATVRMAQSQVKHRAHITREYAGVPPVHGSASRLGQVFLNLIMNAYQALPEGRASEHHIRISARAQDEEAIVVEIEDNGQGIPPQALSRIFDPYFTTRADEGGTGIGLALCRAIVLDMGGQIDVASKLDQGTCVRVTLRRAPSKKEGQYSSSVVKSLKISPRRVLLVDDNTLIQRSFSRVLRTHHIEVASSGREAIERLSRDTDFDIIICDLHMPDGTGQDVFEYLQAHQAELAERMVFLTGGASSDDMRRFLEQVPNRTLSKPCDNYDLRAVVLETPLLRKR